MLIFFLFLLVTYAHICVCPSRTNTHTHVHPCTHNTIHRNHKNHILSSASDLQKHTVTKIGNENEEKVSISVSTEESHESTLSGTHHFPYHSFSHFKIDVKQMRSNVGFLMILHCCDILLAFHRESFIYKNTVHKFIYIIIVFRYVFILGCANRCR